jgi:putative oxidoreductase
MTLVIQVFVYPSAWSTHLSWAAILLPLVVHGGGAWSLDAIMRRALAGQAPYAGNLSAPDERSFA